MSIEQDLARDEGLSLELYPDSVGKITIGFGRNIEDRGISMDEAALMLKNDIAHARESCEKFSWYAELDPKRQDVVLNMMFNLGETRFRSFKLMIAGLELRDYDYAAREMLDSKWAQQVGVRASRLAAIMRSV